jgi:hypothetical protein
MGVRQDGRMGELGELLALLHTAPSRFRTLRAVVREWSHHARQQAALERRAEHGGPGFSFVLYGGTGEPAPETSEWRTRLWLAPPRWRSEHLDADGSGHVSACDGERLRMLFQQTAIERAASGSPPPLIADPPALLGGYDFSLDGETEWAGRRALRVMARERHPGDSHWPVLALGSDAHELLVDAERGVLLRLASLLDGEPFRVQAVLELAFDEDLPEELFALEAPPGARFQGPDDLPRPRHVGLDEAVALVSFPLYVPARLAGPSQLDHCVVHLDGSRERVQLHYTLGLEDRLMLDEAPEGASAPGTAWAGAVSVSVSRPGTHVVLQGTLSREELDAIASSLVRAPMGPPPLEDA